MPVDEALSKPYKNVSIQLILNDRPNRMVGTNEELHDKDNRQDMTEGIRSGEQNELGIGDPASHQHQLDPKTQQESQQVYSSSSGGHIQGEMEPKVISRPNEYKEVPKMQPELTASYQFSMARGILSSSSSGFPPGGAALPLPLQPNTESKHQNPHQGPNQVQPGYPSVPYNNHSIPPYYPVQPVQQEYMDVRHGRRFRRRYNQIVRKYRCLYLGCTKSYGSLNHLNTHIVLKKHGQRKSKADFQTQEEPAQQPPQQVWYGYPPTRAQQPQYIGQVAYDSGLPQPYFIQRPTNVGWMVEPPILYHHQLVGRQIMPSNLGPYPGPSSSQNTPLNGAQPPIGLTPVSMIPNIKQPQTVQPVPPPQGVLHSSMYSTGSLEHPLVTQSSEQSTEGKEAKSGDQRND